MRLSSLFYAICATSIGVQGCNLAADDGFVQEVDQMNTSSVPKLQAPQSVAQIYANQGKQFLGNKFDQNANLSDQDIPPNCSVNKALAIGLEGSLKSELEGSIPVGSDGEQFSRHCPEELADSIQHAFDAGADLRKAKQEVVAAQQRRDYLEYMAGSSNLSAVERRLLEYQANRNLKTIEQAKSNLQAATEQFNMISMEAEG